MKDSQIVKKYKKIIIMLAAMTFVIGAAFFVYLKSIPVNNYVLPVSMATPDIGRMDVDGYYFDSEHADELTEDKQKIFLNIPTEVSKGSYTLRVGYRSGAGSNMSVVSKSNPGAVKCDYVALTHLPEELPGEFSMNYGLDYLPGFVSSEMYVTKDVKDLDVFVIYCGYQYFHIESVELIGNRNYIKTIFPMFMLILLVIDILIFVIISVKTVDRNCEQGIRLFNTYRNIGIVIFISVISSIPLFFGQGLQFDDGHFLYAKINGIMDGLREGQFPVRIHPNTLQGYGYGVSYFYPEIFLYPFGIMRLLGYSLRFTVGALIFCINLSTAVVSFISIKKIFKSDYIAIIGTAIYSLGLYRILDVFSRGAVAEAMAIIFLPLFVWGIYEIIANDGSIVPLTISLFGLINTHILSCEMLALFSIMLCIPCYKLIFKKSSFIKLASSAIISAFLSLYFIFPLLHMSTTDSYKVYIKNAYDTSSNMLSLGNLFAITSSGNGKFGTGDFIGVRYTLGIVIMVLAVVLFVLFIFLSRKDKQYNVQNGFTAISFVFGVIAAILSTSLFPWKAVENVGGIVRTIFCMVQFPWRYLSIVMVCFTFSICGCLRYVYTFLNENNMSKKITALYIVGSVAGVMMIMQVMLLFASLTEYSADEYRIYDGSYLRKYSCTGMGEYEPENFDNTALDLSMEELQYKMNPEAIINPSWMGGEGGLSIGPLAKSGTDTSIIVINQSDKEEKLYFPLTWYEGYKVSNIAEDPNGNNVVPVMSESELGTVMLTIPVGYYNGVHIEYKEPWIYRIAEFISLITLFIVGMYKFKSRDK